MGKRIWVFTKKIYLRRLNTLSYKEYYEKNKERIKEQKRIYGKKYYKLNKEKIKNNNSIYRNNNKEKRNKRDRKRHNDNIKIRLRQNLKTRINDNMKNRVKSDNTLSLIGCTIIELKSYLENKFIDGMSWENYGKWHIDHIKPCAKFDLSLDSEQRKCFHYTNLQPLWASDNCSKQDKYKEK